MINKQPPTTYLDDSMQDRDAYANIVDEKKVTILPGSGKAVGLGVYKSALPAPVVDITFSPNLKEDIGVTEEHLALSGESRYMLLYQFHNFSQEPCEVTMHLRQVTAAS